MRRLLLSLSASLALVGCLDESASVDPAQAATGESRLVVDVAPFASLVAGRGMKADPGGMLSIEVSNASKGFVARDSSPWTGSVEARLEFPSLPEGTGYVVRASYRDPQGFATHGDSIGGVTLTRGEDRSIALSLRALLGRILLNAPSLPVSVDTLSVSWSSAGVSRKMSTGRGSGGRTTLRLDSLPVATSGTVRLRAWNTSKDTLFHLDTTLALSGDKDLPLALLLQSTRGTILASLGFLDGGEIGATASFEGEPEQPSDQTGRLLLAAFSDSGAADWIGIVNPTKSAFTGRVRLGKGTTDAQFDLNLPAGDMAVVTRAPCAAIDSLHPLHAAKHLVCGVDDIVVTHSTSGGSLWKLRSADASELLDQVLVLDGKQSWPDLNTSTARTARLSSAWASATSNDAGRAWCADGSDAPAGSCN
jgi:hypothetical protein